MKNNMKFYIYFTLMILDGINAWISAFTKDYGWMFFNIFLTLYFAHLANREIKNDPKRTS